MRRRTANNLTGAHAGNCGRAGARPMTAAENTLVCWKCGASLAALSLPIQRLDACRQCGAELHVCRMCADYAVNLAKKCREPVAEEVFEKERANFCGFYQPRPGAYVPRDDSAAVRSKDALEALFGGGSSVGPSSVDQARSALEDLFRKT